MFTEQRLIIETLVERVEDELLPHEATKVLPMRGVIRVVKYRTSSASTYAISPRTLESILDAVLTFGVMDANNPSMFHHFSCLTVVHEQG